MSRPGFAFDHLFEHASDPAFVVDPFADRFVAANQAVCAMLGYALDELLATPVSRIHPGDLPQLQEVIGEVLGRGHGSTITLTCRTKTGAFLPTEMSLYAVESGGRRYILGLVQDRSEHRQRERPPQPSP